MSLVGRYTTPTHIFTVPFDTGTISMMAVIYKQGGNVVLVKDLEDCTLGDKTVSCTLTEEETSLFKPNPGDTVDAASLLKGKTAHDKTGAPITGTCPYDADTSDATATAAEILNGKTGYVDGAKVTGTMPNKGAVTLAIVDKSTVAIPAGYHDGSGSAAIDSTEAAKIIAGNIKSGVSILGVTGDYAGELTKGQKKTVTPAKAQFSVLPDDGYDFLSEVVVNGVPIAYADNPAGGQTVTIGA